MGSILSGYLKQRDLRNFARNQAMRISGQLGAVDDQVHRIIRDDICSQCELARSTYLHHYVIGVLDSITSFYERETRRRLGLDLYREIFVRYLCARFQISRSEAETLFAEASEKLNKESGLIEDGYADGLAALRSGCRASRLLNHFSRRVSRTADSPADVPRLVAVAG